MRVLLTGAGGMLGSDLHRELRRREIDTIAVGREELDITSEPDVTYLFQQVRPDVVANCAAYTAVDACEENRELAHVVNAQGVAYLAENANRWSSLLVHFSTDFVFDGERRRPYEVDDPVSPVSVYGESKLAGERSAATAWKHLIVRTSWVFGPGGHNFVEAITRQIEGGNTHLRVVDDQRGRPTYVPHLVDATLRLLEVAMESEEGRGIVHYADQPPCTWYELALSIVEELRSRGRAPEDLVVEPVTTEEMPRPARRPAYSVLSTAKYEAITGADPALWQMGLIDYFDRRERRA
jgi:dTDP-4-dehydrorhamnose reductase